MKTKNKIFTGIIAMILSCVLLFVTVTISPNTNGAGSVSAGTRTVELSHSSVDAQSILDEFENSTLVTEGSVTYFEGYKALDKNQLSEIDYISETDFEELEDCQVKYNFSYDSETNIVTLAAAAELPDGSIEVDELYGMAFLDDNGEIDAMMDIDGEFVLLSEMREAGMIQNCGWFTNLIKSVVKVAVATATAIAAAATIVGTSGIGAVAVIATVGIATCVASTTQTVKANTNYAHNKKQSLHTDVNAKGYITDQNYYTDWCFGFSKLSDVGCEVIATYNAMIKLGKKKSLADVIYDFEMMNIDFDIGFGALGSNPRQVYRYLIYYGINYTAYSSFSTLKSAADSMDSCTIIFTTQNNDSVMGIHSMHAFMIEKEQGIYRSYNGNITLGSKNLSDAIEYKFEYAYIVG